MKPTYMEMSPWLLRPKDGSRLCPAGRAGSTSSPGHWGGQDTLFDAIAYALLPASAGTGGRPGLRAAAARTTGDLCAFALFPRGSYTRCAKHGYLRPPGGGRA